MKLGFIKREDLNVPNTSVYETSPETPIRFCFVGPRGVGKTSLLASMYHQIKKNGVNNVFVDIHSDDGARTYELLNDAHQDMLDMIEDTEKGQLASLEPTLKGTQDPITYSFVGSYTVIDTDILKLTDYKTFRFDFQFTDMPGYWYDVTGNPHKEDVKAYLENSVASFLAIDTPALMKGIATCKRNNCFDVIEEWYKNSATELANRKHTVIIVLSRCEKFWNQQKTMLEKLSEIYGSMIDMLKANGVEVYVTWIKTLGGIEFSHYEKATSEEGKRIDHARFIRTGEYEPDNCATPLQLALERGLVRAAENIEPVNIVEDIFGIKHLAKEAAQSMARELKEKMHAGDVNTFKKL